MSLHIQYYQLMKRNLPLKNDSAYGVDGSSAK